MPKRSLTDDMFGDFMGTMESVGDAPEAKAEAKTEARPAPEKKEKEGRTAETRKMEGKKQEATAKKAKGRKRKYEEERVQYTLRIPPDLAGDLELAESVFRTKNEYLVKLVREDMERNRSLYEEMGKMLGKRGARR